MSEYKPGIPLIKSVTKGGVLVEFIASPTGLFGLAYNPGEQARFSKEQVKYLLDAEVAKEVKKPKAKSQKTTDKS